MEMRMKKAYLLSALLLVALGCNREDGIGTPDKVKTLSAVASSYAPTTRSHFDTDGLHLLWDAEEQLGVYSINLGPMSDILARVEELRTQGIRPNVEFDRTVVAMFEAMTVRSDKLRKGVCRINPADVGKSWATFDSGKPIEDWFGMENPADDDIFCFPAFYPAPDDLAPMEIFQYQNLTGLVPDMIDALDAYFIPVEIPVVQDGRSYWDYQILFDSGTNDDECTEATGITTYQAHADGAPLRFAHLKPVTCMLAFTMQLAPAATVENCQISKITIQVESEVQPGEGYFAGAVFLAGKLPLFPFCDKDSEIQLWNRITEPRYPGNDRIWGMQDGTWSRMADASSSMTLQFSEPITIKKSTATDDTFYAVLAPTSNLVGSEYAHPRYTFAAYDAEGQEILFSRVTTAAQEGLLKGRKYSFNLLLGETATDLTMDAEAGQYITEQW